MKILFKNIKIENFLSIGNADINLKENGFTLIKGINNCKKDNTISCGAGKSAIFEAIVYALCGETTRGVKDIVNKNTSDGVKVELNFEVDGVGYLIIRTKEHQELKTNLRFYVNGEDKSGKGSRDTERILQEYFPDLTQSLISSVIVLGQGLPARFTNNTPSGRKEVLEDLSKSDFMIEDIKCKLTKRKNHLNDAIRDLEDSILSDSSKKSILENQLQRLKENKSLLVPLDSFDKDIESNETQLAMLSNSQIDTYNNVLQLNTKLNEKLEEYQKWVASVNDNINSESIHIQEKHKLKELSEELTVINNEVKAKEQEILKLESIKDICPTCGQHLPDVHKVDTTVMRGELEILQNTYASKYNYYNEQVCIVDKEIDNLKLYLNKTTEEIKQAGTLLRIALNEANDNNQKYLNEISNIKSVLDKLKLNKENNEKQYANIDGEIEKCQIDIKQLSNKILLNTTNKDNETQHLEIISKMITLATRDFRGYLLEGIIEYINNVSKQYSLIINKNDNFVFELNGNNIDISFNGKIYESLSGGEKQKIDLIIQFALRDMLANVLNLDTNILCLDEIFDNLDYSSCESVLNFIITQLSSLESVFIITHHNDLQIPYDTLLIVSKNEDGVSSIQ